MGDARADGLWREYVTMEITRESIEDEVAGTSSDGVNEMGRKFFSVGDWTCLLRWFRNFWKWSLTCEFSGLHEVRL